MRIPAAMAVLWLVLGATAIVAQESDRHAARREWLARRRAGELADTPAAAVPAAPARGQAQGGPVGPPPAPVRHRFADRFTPNHEVPARGPELWPLEPVRPRWGGGFGTPWGSWHGSQPGWGSYAWECARVTLLLAPGGRVDLFLLLAPAVPYDPVELELLLDRRLSAGEPLMLHTAEGLPVRVRPGARIEGVVISRCAPGW